MLRSLALFLNILYLVTSQDDKLFTSTTLSRKNNSNFLEFGESSYYFDTELQTNFYGAIQYCKIRNMELVSIESAAENDRIGLFLVERGWASMKFWTSAVNLVEGGRWIWLSTGKHIKYFNWDRGEPTGVIPFVSSYENCIQARHEGTRGFTWNDLYCGVKNYAICERPIICSCPAARNY